MINVIYRLRFLVKTKYLNIIYKSEATSLKLQPLTRQDIYIKTSIAAAETLTKYPKWWHIPLCKHIPRGESRSKLHFHYVSKMCYIWVCNRNRKCSVKSSILENDELSNFTQIIHIINFDFGSFRIITHIVIRFSRNWQYQSLNMI